MSKEERNGIYRLALARWGNRAQLEMVEEEALELALAARKYIRKDNNANFSNLIEETADVEIMIEQLDLMFKTIKFREQVDEVKTYKIIRLIERLNGNEK